MYTAGMTDCIFCKIIAGEIPSEKVYEDEHVIGFLDINPVNPGHTLIIPKVHARNMFDISKDSWEHVMQVVHMLAPVVQRAVGAEGINIGMNNESIAGQVVMHAHVHIMPRTQDDGHALWKGTPYAEGDMARTAEAIRQQASL